MQSSSQHGRCLGVGAKGSVFLGFNRDNGHLVAVKELTLPGDDTGRSDEVAAIANEVSLMKSFQHPNLVAYLGVRSAGASRIHILMEYVPGGSIGKLVARFGALPERVCKRYIRDVLAALVYLHVEKLVCHRDVKPDNILLTAEGRCKLCDFGTGKSVESGIAEYDGTSLNTCVGTPSYMAPEVLEGQGYGTKADVWSLGVTLFELLSGAAPFTDCANPYAVMYRITTGELPVLAPELGVSADGSQFLQMCMEPDAALRPTAAALLDHPWISGVDTGVDDITNAVIMATTPRKGSSPGSSPSRTPPRATSHRDSGVEEEEAVSDSDKSPLYPCHRCGVSATFECDDCRRVFGRLYRTCPSCWEPIHAALPRGKHHVKRPLLLDSTAPHHDGVLLESGAYVDLCGSGGAGWTCGRCNTFNGSMSPSCEMCNHLR